MSDFTRIPYDVLRTIALVSEPTDVIRLACVSRAIFIGLTTDNALWQTLFRLKFPIDELEAKWLIWHFYNQSLQQTRDRQRNAMLQLRELGATAPSTSIISLSGSAAPNPQSPHSSLLQSLSSPNTLWFRVFRQRFRIEQNWRAGRCREQNLPFSGSFGGHSPGLAYRSTVSPTHAHASTQNVPPLPGPTPSLSQFTNRSDQVSTIYRQHLAIVRQTMGQTLLYDYVHCHLVLMEHRQADVLDMAIGLQSPVSEMHLPPEYLPRLGNNNALLTLHFIVLLCRHVSNNTTQLVVYRRGERVPTHMIALHTHAQLFQLCGDWLLLKMGRQPTVTWRLYNLACDQIIHDDWSRPQSQCHLHLSGEAERMLAELSDGQRFATTDSTHYQHIIPFALNYHRPSHLARSDRINSKTPTETPPTEKLCISPTSVPLFRAFRSDPTASYVQWELVQGTRQEDAKILVSTKLRQGRFRPTDATGFQDRLNSTYVNDDIVLLYSGVRGSNVNWFSTLSLQTSNLIWERSEAGELLVNFYEHGFFIHGRRAEHIAQSQSSMPPSGSTSMISELQQVRLQDGMLLRRFSCHCAFIPPRIIGTLCLVGVPRQVWVMDMATGRKLYRLDFPSNTTSTIQHLTATGCVAFDENQHSMKLFSFE
jgi:hypothetical protein